MVSERESFPPTRADRGFAALIAIRAAWFAIRASDMMDTQDCYSTLF
jgi:hypothetical protein